MEEMTVDEFKKSIKDNPEGLMFSIECKKCLSKDVIMEVYDDLHMGSEYTGLYGDAGILLKCKGCGNAYKLMAVSQ